MPNTTLVRTQLWAVGFTFRGPLHYHVDAAGILRTTMWAYSESEKAEGSVWVCPFFVYYSFLLYSFACLLPLLFSLFSSFLSLVWTRFGLRFQWGEFVDLRPEALVSEAARRAGVPQDRRLRGERRERGREDERKEREREIKEMRREKRTWVELKKQGKRNRERNREAEVDATKVTKCTLV